MVNKRNDHGGREYELAGLAAVEARDSIVFGCVIARPERWGDRGRREEEGCGYRPGGGSKKGRTEGVCTMVEDIIEGQGQRIEVMLLGARSRVTNSGGFRVLPAGAAAAVVRGGVQVGETWAGDGGAVARGGWRRGRRG